MRSLEDLRRDVDRRMAKLSAAKERRRVERENLSALSSRVEALEEAQKLAQRVSQTIQTTAHSQIAEIVSRCLAIFEEPYTFQIHFDRKRGRTEARLTFQRDGLEVDPLGASGGGVVDVASFALRVACLMLSRPPCRRLLVLDEPFKMLSWAHGFPYRERVRELLESLSAEMGIQIVMVTHDPELTCGKVIELTY